MKNLKKLRKIIIKEIPEIVELKFGCGVIYKKRNYIFASFHKQDRTNLIDKTISYMTEIRSSQDYFKNNVKIIGRPIRLSDVLRVLVETTFYNRKYFEINQINKETDGTVIIFKEKYGRVSMKWNLEKDNLNDQSEETIDFLLNILK